MPAHLAYFYISQGYMIMAVFVIIFSLYAQIKVSSAYNKNSQIGSRGGMTGRDVRFVNGDYARPPDYVGPPEIYAWVRHRAAPPEAPA